MLRTGRRVENYVELCPPKLGAVRLPASHARGLHRGCAELFHATGELTKQSGPASLGAAAGLADSVILMVGELIGHDLHQHRVRFCEAAHFGGLLAVAEERGGRSAPQRSEAHADMVLACVQSQFSDPDKLAEQLMRWALESGYFLVRTGGTAQALLAGLRADLVRWLAELDESKPSPTRLARVPHPARASDREVLGSRRG